MAAVTTFVYPPPGSISISGGATAAKQDTQITSLQLLDDAVSTTGSAVPAKGYQVTGSDGTNARALKTDSNGELQIDVLSSALPSGAATEATLSTLSTNIADVKKTEPGTGTKTLVIGGSDGAGAFYAMSVDTNGRPQVEVVNSLPIGSAVIGQVGIDQTTPGSTNKVNIGNDGQVAATQSGSWTVAATKSGTWGVDASQSGTWTVQPGNTANTTAWLVKEETSSTATVTSVNDTASSTSLLASNTSRKGAMFFNDSTSILYLKLGTTASTTSYTVQIPPSGYYELPGPKIYTGAIDGIWSADASGAVRITELT